MALILKIIFLSGLDPHLTGKFALLKSTNNVSSWTSSNISTKNGRIIFITFYSKDIIFLGTLIGVYRSIDGGENWTEINSSNVSSIVINSNHDIFAGNQQGVFRLDNNGNDWTLIGAAHDGTNYLAIDANDNIFGTFYTGGLYRSTDTGINWTKVNDSWLSITSNKLGFIFGGTEYLDTMNYKSGIFLSTDKGDNWSEIYHYSTTYNNNNSLWQYQSTGATAVSPNGHIFVGVNDYYYGYDEQVIIDHLNSKVIKSTDYGNSWSSSNIYMGDNESNAITNIAINSNGVIFVGTSEKGVYRSTDEGLNWTNINNGFPIKDINGQIDSSIRIYSMAINSTGDIFVDAIAIHYSNLYKIYKSTNNGDNWNETWTSNNNIQNLAINSKDYILASTGGGVYQSTDGGNTWATMNNGFLDNFYRVNYLAINSKDYLFAGTDNGVYRRRNTNTDTSSTPATISIVPPTVNIGDSVNVSIKVENFNNVGTISLKIIYNPNYLEWSRVVNCNDQLNSVYTEDKNDTISITWNGEAGVNISASKILDLRFLLKDGYPEVNFLYNECEIKDLNGKVIQTYFASGNLPVELTSFSANENREQVLLNWSTATETNNRGFEIQRKNSNEKELSWNSIGFVDGNGTTTKKKTYSFFDKSVSSGTYLYRLKQIDFDGTFTYSKEIEINFSAPLTFSLSQNYPNPFNPTTTIKYTLPEDSNVKLTLINSLGEKVIDLVNGKVDSGNHDVKLNGSNLASGIYFYRLQTEKYTSVKKLILLK